jgi:thymidine phosphorylase
VGRGIGPALEARDVLAVLQNSQNAPEDLKQRALLLAGSLLEIAGLATHGEGESRAESILISGKAWEKFHAICEAQGGYREPETAPFTHEITAEHPGTVSAIDNRRLAKIAKLAGAPHDATAGLTLHTVLDTRIETGQPLITIHAEARGTLKYALEYVQSQSNILEITS